MLTFMVRSPSFSDSCKKIFQKTLHQMAALRLGEYRSCVHTFVVIDAPLLTLTMLPRSVPSDFILPRQVPPQAFVPHRCFPFRLPTILFSTYRLVPTA